MPVIQSFSPRDYNSVGQIWTILQDRRGVMYFGNSSGSILEYDGVSWRKVFISSNVVRSLTMDDTGRIWVGADGNFGYLSPDAMARCSMSRSSTKSRRNRETLRTSGQIVTTPKGIFFRSYERLFRWDGQRMWLVDSKSRFQALSAVRGHIYTSQNGIGLQEIVGDELRNLPGGDAYRNAGKLFLHPFDETHVLISARDQLLTLYDGQKSTPFPTEADGYLAKHKPYTSTLLADGSLCVTTLNGGAVILGHDGKIRQILDEATGLSSIDALSAYEDRDGVLWLGLSTGIARIEINSPISIFSLENNLDVARLNGSIYTVSGGGRAAAQRLVPDPETGRLKPLTLGGGASQGFALALFKDPTGKTPDQLLAATSDGIMKVAGDALVPAMPALHGLTEQAYAVIQSHKTPESCVYRSRRWCGFHALDGHAWIDEGRLPNLVYESRGLTEDGEGNLWVSGGNGKVIRVDVAPSGMRDSKTQILSQKEGLAEGANDAEFVAGSIFVLVDRSKSIFRWDDANKKFVVDNRFLLPIDAPDASAFLIPATKGDFWAASISSDSSRIGLFSRQPDGSWHADEDRYRVFTRFRGGTVHIEPDGAIWLTGEKLIRYKPVADQTAPKPFPTAVRQVNAGSRVVFGGTDIPESSELRLPPNSNALRFQFAALAYENPAEIDYQYFLEGADRDWSSWGRQKEANYSGPRSGELSVSHSLAYGRWSGWRRRVSTASRSYRLGIKQRLPTCFMVFFCCCWLSPPGGSSAGMSVKRRGAGQSCLKRRRGLLKRLSMNVRRRFVLKLSRLPRKRTALSC